MQLSNNVFFFLNKKSWKSNYLKDESFFLIKIFECKNILLNKLTTNVETNQTRR